MKKTILFLFILASFSGTLVLAADTSGFYMSTPQSFKFEVGKTTNHVINWNVRVKQVKVIFRSTSPLPNGISINVSDGAISWNPSENEKLARYEIKIEATVVQPDGRYPYPATIYVESLPRNRDPYSAAYDAKIECDRTLEAWKNSQVVGGGSPEPSSGGQFIQTMPTTLYQWESFFSTFKNYPPPDFKSENKNSDSILNIYNLFFLKSINVQNKTNFLTSEVRNLLKLSDFYSKNIPVSFRNEDDQRFALSMFVESSSTLERVIATIANDINSNSGHSPTGNFAYDVEKINKFILKELEGISLPRGVIQPDLLFLYTLTLENTNVFGLFRFAKDYNKKTAEAQMYERKIRDRAREIFVNKTTPSVECNNLARDLKLVPISWEDLGMSTYEAPGAWFPWVNQAIARNVGKSMFDNPLAWELSKILPVFGTALSLADGSLSLYEGKDINGQDLGSLGKGLVALQISASAFETVGIAYNISKYRNLAQRYRQIAATNNEEEIVRGLIDANRNLRRELRYSTPIQSRFRPCFAGNQRGRLSEDYLDYTSKTFEPLSDYSVIHPFFENIGCKLDSFYDDAGNLIANISHEDRAIPDTNIVIAKARFDYYKKLSNGDDKKLFEDLLAFWKSDPKTRDPKGAALNNIIVGITYEERYGNKIFMTDQVVSELSNHLVSGLIRRDEMEVFFSNFDVKFISMVSLDQETSLLPRLSQIFKNYKVANNTSGSSGDGKLASEVMLAIRKYFGKVDPSDMPTLVSADFQLVADLINLSKGLPKEVGNLNNYVLETVLKPMGGSFGINIRFQYEKLKGILGSGPKGADYKIGTKVANPNLPPSRDNPALPITEPIDFTNMPFNIGAVPTRCSNFSSKIIYDAYPESVKEISKIMEANGLGRLAEPTLP